MTPSRTHTVHIVKLGSDGAINAEDTVATEEPLEILLYGIHQAVPFSKPISITMRTPGHDRLLASGFLFTEGILHSVAEMDYCRQSDENQVSVKLVDDARVDVSRLERHFYTNSSCGVCGKTSVENLRSADSMKLITSDLLISSETIFSLNDKVREAQSVFKSTGGLHASAAFDSNGNLLDLFEDVGRHNALDKLIGNYFLKDALPLSGSILFLSGRASFELIQKAAMAGIPVVCALGAPSSMAVELALEFNITLIGFLKNQSMNIYSHPQRIANLSNKL